MNTRIFVISLAMLVFVSLVIGCSSQATSPVEDSNTPEVENTLSQTSEQTAVEENTLSQTSEQTAVEENTLPQTSEQTTVEENSAAALDGKTLVEARCTVCHGLGKVESASMNQEQWKNVVENMVSKGADLSAEEQTVVIEYLATTYP